MIVWYNISCLMWYQIVISMLEKKKRLILANNYPCYGAIIVWTKLYQLFGFSVPV